MKKKKKLGKGQIVLHAAFILLVLMYVVPFVLTISISFSDETSLIRNGYSLIPHEFSLEAYKMVFRNPGQILQSYKVTILFTVVAHVVYLAYTKRTPDDAEPPRWHLGKRR